MHKAPDFSLKNQDGITCTLKDYAGQWILLYFYPRDDTPGCTAEACSFRDERNVFAELGATQVIGISKDSVASHKKFADKYHLNFTLLSDPEHKVIEAYGAWGSRTFMGREFMGVHRNTYIISPDGYIVREFRNVDPKTHIARILNNLEALQTVKAV